MNNKKSRLLACETMKEHYMKMLDTSLSELTFEKTQEEFLLYILNELETINDPLVRSIVKNGKEKYNLNKLLHTRNLFQ